MIPIVTPAEMAAMDASAPDPVEVLIGRAGAAVARAAVDILGGCYGRRVIVIAGKGNNGNDGREAARRLRARGARVVEIDPLDPPGMLPKADLVIDAAFGTGFKGRYSAPVPATGSAVLAVDIPSGVDGLTGQACGDVMRADATVTFAALKPGLLLGMGPDLAGEILVADIGLDTSGATTHLVEESDAAAWLAPRVRETHKWRSALCVIAGSTGMEGAAALVCSSALRSGAGYVRWCSPGGDLGGVKPVEVVGVAAPRDGWADLVSADSTRFAAFVVGNGLGLDPVHRDQIRSLVTSLEVPVVVDADAITHMGVRPDWVSGRDVIFTPHDAEFARLAGDVAGSDRIASVRELAQDLGAVVVLKGSTTIVADPCGEVLVCVEGDDRLATLGTGDVLAGVIAGLCASGVEPFRAAALGAFIHGRAADLGWRRGLVATDLVNLLPRAIARIASGEGD